jgi:hypothetical protein
MSAHLDHLGMGAPIKGDNTYNGAMDNANGVATLIETARRTENAKLGRSVLFVVRLRRREGPARVTLLCRASDCHGPTNGR